MMCKTMPKNIIAKIISNEEVKKGCFKMVLSDPAIAKAAKPGQFLHVRCKKASAPLLRRPISIHRVKGGRIELLFDAVGVGTGILSRLGAGDKLDIVGPLGNGFEIPAEKYGLYLLVGGGFGVAPLLSLADKLKSRRIDGNRIIVALGAKNKTHILCEKEFRSLGAKVYVATDDGSAGKKGLVTALARDIIKNSGLASDKILIYAAGPIGMIRALCGASGSCSLKSQVSLEERMGCGLGACRGCVIPTRNGYKSVCKDGPVFRMSEVL